MNDVGAVSQVPPEDPNVVIQSLVLLEQAIAKIPDKQAYDTACSHDPDYVTADFRLKFLRADNFDVGKAAVRIIRHFAEKLNLFGEEKLARDITLSDLSREDLHSLSYGWLQVLPRKDKAGRPVLASIYRGQECGTRGSMNRGAWYIIMSMMEDDESQKTGLTYIRYEVGHKVISVDYERLRQLSKLVANILPVRLMAVHMGLNDARWQPLTDLVVQLMSPFTRNRFRAHFGECSLGGIKLSCFQTLLLAQAFTDHPSCF
jgi:hypothetical protein